MQVKNYATTGLATLGGALALIMAGCASQGGSGSSTAPARVATTGEEVIAAMHDRYDDSWYSTLRFRQNVIRTRPDGTAMPTEVWLEHAEIPGKLRIDLAANYNGNAQTFNGDSLFVFQNGKLTRRLKNRNPLMVLGFDIYRQPVATSLQVLREEGFDFTKFRQDTWQGRPAYVVGADAGDLKAKQFWIDRERLVFTRLIMPAGPQGARTQEIRFDNYQPIGGGWIAPLVLFFVDGKETMREEYFDMEANVKLPAGLFDPDQFDKVKPN